jgi:hypothetical protein
MGKENVYEGETVCSCGRTVKATFVIEALEKKEIA